MTQTIIDKLERADGPDRECPATFGREALGHSWVEVTGSSYRRAPYTMCSKCGATRARSQGGE